MSVALTNFITVFQTEQSVYFDWACNTLDQANIPYQRRQENAGGGVRAMPVMPTPASGVWWSILVPESHASVAREALEALPFIHEPPARPDSQQNIPRWRHYAGWGVGLIIIGSILWEVFEQVARLIR